MDDISRRRAELRWGDQVLELTTYENDAEEEHHLTDLQGWYGGVGVYGTQPQRELGHGLFPRPALRTGRALTLKGSLWFREESWRDLADRYVSGILWDGQFGTLTYTVDGLELSTRVRLDGEVKHATKGHQWIDVEVPLSAPDPFLYAPEAQVSITPLGYGEGARLATGPFEGDVFRFYGGPPPGGVLTNQGNAQAWPRFVVRGAWPGGFRISCGRRSIVYPHPVYEQAPLTVDTRVGSVSVRGADQTHLLTRREWFSVPPHGTVTVRIDPYAPSEGWMDAYTRDTYI